MISTLEQVLVSFYRYLLSVVSVWSIRPPFFALFQSVGLAVVAFTMIFMASIYAKSLIDSDAGSISSSKIYPHIVLQHGLTLAFIGLFCFVVYILALLGLSFDSLLLDPMLYIIFLVSFSYQEASRRIYYMLNKPLAFKSLHLNYHIFSISRVVCVLFFAVDMKLGKLSLALHSILSFLSVNILLIRGSNLLPLILEFTSCFKFFNYLIYSIVSLFRSLILVILSTKSWIAEAITTFASRQLFFILALSNSPPLVMKEYVAIISSLNILNILFEAIPVHLAPNYKKAIKHNKKKYNTLILSDLTLFLSFILFASLLMFFLPNLAIFNFILSFLSRLNISITSLAITFFFYSTLICLNRFFHTHLIINNRHKSSSLTSVIGLMYSFGCFSLIDFYSLDSLLFFTVGGYFVTFICYLVLELTYNLRSPKHI